jgi:hypothetical protein
VKDRERLRRVIRDLHGVESSYLRSERVHEMFEGETVWEGMVEVYSLKGHPKAGLAYGWGEDTDDGGRRYVAILGLAPIRSARDAVLASIVAQHQS